MFSASLWFILAGATQARINVVTLPGRDSVQLTIYNSADLTMVKETRLLTFRKGLNKLEFSWANTLIDPTSVEFHALTHADQVEVLDVRFPPRVTNTLEWRIQSEVAGEVQVEIRYFTSGITWSADYIAEANKTEKLMDLAGYVRVTNNSGEDYENAETRLVVGVVHLVDEVAQLARAGRPIPTTQAFDEGNRKFPMSPFAVYREFVALDGTAGGGGHQHEIIKEGLSEYFLYTVEGRDTIPNGWSKRLPSFRAADVPIVSYYKYEEESKEQEAMVDWSAPMPRITLNFRNIPLIEAIKYVTMAVGLRYRITSEAVIVLPQYASDPEPQSPTRERSDIIRRVNDIVLRSISFRDAAINDVLAFLSDESRRLDPEGRGVSIVLQKNASFPVWRNQEVTRYYRFKNDKECKLGNEPLPDGQVMAFRTITSDNLYDFVGRTAVKYIPIGEQVELNLGNDLEVMVKPKLMNWVKTDIRFDKDGNVDGWTIKETWQFEVQNSKDIDVVFDIRRNFAGDWSLETGTKYEKVDAHKVKFVLPLKSHEKQMFSYELTTRYGTNVTK